MSRAALRRQKFQRPLCRCRDRRTVRPPVSQRQALIPCALPWEARAAMSKHIETWYNSKRPYPTLGYLSPIRIRRAGASRRPVCAQHDADVLRCRARRGDGRAGEDRMNGCLAAKPPAPGTRVRPIGSVTPSAAVARGNCCRALCHPGAQSIITSGRGAGKASGSRSMTPYVDGYGRLPDGSATRAVR